MRRMLQTGFFLAALTALTPSALAQQPDLAALEKSYSAAFAAGQYPRAYADALKLEAGARARFGQGSALHAQALGYLAEAQRTTERFAEAENTYKQALAIRTRLNPKDIAISNIHLGMGRLYRYQFRLAEADAAYRDALTTAQNAAGANSPAVGQVLIQLTDLRIASSGNMKEAEEFALRALAIFEKESGPSSINVAYASDAVAAVYLLVQRMSDAERFYKRSLAIKEKVLGVNASDVAVTLANLAIAYNARNDTDEAEKLWKRALGIQEKALGPDHSQVAGLYNNLAAVAFFKGRNEEADRLFQRALSIEEKSVGMEHPFLGRTLGNLAGVNLALKRNKEAEAYVRRSIAIYEKALGPDHSALTVPLSSLAKVAQAQGRPDEAQQIQGRALAIFERNYGPTNPRVASEVWQLALLLDQAGKPAEALEQSRRVTDILVAHILAESAGAQEKGREGASAQLYSGYFHTHLQHLGTAAKAKLVAPQTLTEEGFEVAQWASQSSAAAALQQMGLRFAAGSDRLGLLVRESQDVAAALRRRDKELVDAVAKPAREQNSAQLEKMRSDVADLEKRLAAVAARLEREMPEYAALVNPRPQKISEVQNLLAPDEAMVFLLASHPQSYVFVLTSERVSVTPLALSNDDITAKVTAFRKGLDVDELRAADAGSSKAPFFDLALAHELYRALLAPIEAEIKDKPNLIVVPSGVLTALPFHLLVTDAPKIAQPSIETIAAYRDAEWLLKRHAVSVLPSVSSLQALRTFARKDRGTKPMIGFGDPLFQPEAAPASKTQQRAAKKAAKTRALSDYWQGAGIDPAMISQALSQLPDTADELKAVAQKLAAPSSDLYLGRVASEAVVKVLPLADYRVVYFATHGLVAGDVKGVAEPSLALSMPEKPSQADDGLLTASEVAQLKLNADWVVLSACNTAAGDKPGAEALSGLARSFFYAGARALLVSHWAVDSAAATKLTIDTFDVLKSDPRVGRAEAVRRSMLKFMADGSDKLNAHPAMWGPFSVLGEGAAQ